MSSSRKQQFLLVAIVIATLIPFLNKAFCIDDPLFLWMAQQIVRHPLDPYGFTVNWASHPEPFWAQMQNPPLCSYFIALVGSIAGWSEPALHLAFVFWAVMSILGTFVLARRFCRNPLTAALLTLFTPVFLISATNVMCDVMLLAVWIWSIELWLWGLEQNRHWLLLISAILVAAAVVTKYFGIALVPLLGSYTSIRNRKDWPRIFILVIPIFAAVLYELWTKSLYGHGLMTGAIFFAQGATEILGSGAPAQLLIGLAFTGGCLIAPLFFFPVRLRRLSVVSLLLLAGGLILFPLLVSMDPKWMLGPNQNAVRLEGGVFAGIGLSIVALAIVDLARRRDAMSTLLFLWLSGTFVFATFFNWSMTARTILPMVPAAAILLVRFLERAERFPEALAPLAWRISAVAVISLLVCFADYRQANTAREAARIFGRRFSDEEGTRWFQSHWGFQYYMQEGGAMPLDMRNQEAKSGDVIMVPLNSSFRIAIGLDRVSPPEAIDFAVMPFISTMGYGTGAGFYSSIRGPLPWVVDQVSPETYYVARFR